MTAELCAAPFHGGPEPAEPGAYLCRACRRRLRRELRALPGLHAALESAVPEPEVHGHGTHGEVPLPFSEAASLHRDHIKEHLVDWCKTAAEERTRPPRRPGETLADYADRLAPLDCHAPYPPDEVPALAGWLAAQCETGRRGYIPARPWAGEMAAEIGGCHARAWEILEGPPRAIVDLPGSRCTTCRSRLRAVVYDVGDRRGSFVGCPQCRARWDLDGDGGELRSLAACGREVAW